jgi:DNA-binding beta-propeller fold protein YncE
VILATWATGGARSRSNRLAMISRPWVVVLLAATAVTAACTASSEDVRPPENELFFPTGLAMSPDDSAMFVLSANSDLRYDSGTVTAIDVAAVQSAIIARRGGMLDPSCVDDLDTPGAIECEEAPFMFGGGVRIGNFASSLAVQDKGSGNLRVLVPVRGDPSVTWIEYDAATHSMDCGGGQGFELCNDEHRLTQMREDEDLPDLADEPYGIYVDSVSQLAVVTHLASGTVSLVDSPADGTPVLADAISGLFAGNSQSLVRPGATGVAGRLDGAGNIFYVQSRTEDRIQMLTVAREGGATPFLVPSSYFFLNGVGGIGGKSSDGRGVMFDATGNRAYMINRSPPSLMVFDTSLETTGVPRNRLLGASDVCREASSLAIADGGLGERAFVSCFLSGEVYVVDPRGASSVEDVISVGRAPFAMVAAESRQLLFVSTFLEDSIAVIDLDPNSSTYYRVVMRIGVRS